MPTARFSARVWTAIEAAALIAVSTEADSGGPACVAPLEVEQEPQVGGLLQVELLHVQLAVAHAS